MGVYLRTYTSGFSPITDEVDYMSKLIFLDVVLSECKNSNFENIRQTKRRLWASKYSRVKNIRDVCYEPKQLSILRRRYFSKC
ncbi:unnamed protein product [Rhizophagus irregularis]|nr:unnamed protein product [Rhizophagus irregularis]